MKGIYKIFFLFSVILMFFAFPANTTAQEYVGSDQCKMCHDKVNTNLGYNIWEEYMKSGHPYKLNPVDGQAPTYPANTTIGVQNPPDGTNWDDFAYVIGGYGWKARFVKKDGRIFTTTENAQYNLEDGSWVAYHFGEDKKYDAACFVCHTTGAVPEGSWNGVPEDSLGTFSEPGVRCEGCHGPGSEHVASFGADPLPRTGDDLKKTRCGECHQRGGATNAIPVSGGYIKHHEQVNEMNASKHGNSLTCASCHDAHIALRYPDAAGDGLSGITTECDGCHTDKAITINGQPKSIDCIDCHMAPASKSAIGKKVGNGWRGDVKTHIFGINTSAVTKEAMFNDEGTEVKLDNDGIAKVTLDFACLGCHQAKDVEWASSYADGIHENGITVTEDEYVGSSICANCHDKVNSNLGYNIWEEYMKSGHPYKLNAVNGGPPSYPMNTSPGVPNPPEGTTWDDFSWVIGGYGWKARFVKPDGRIFTTTENAQYNLEDGSWVAYHFEEDRKYNAACFVCHTTGAIPEGSWNGVTDDSLGTFSEPGVRCEGCHGPGSLHAASLGHDALPRTGDDLKKTRCGECHQRGGATNAIPVSGGYIKHHEQVNELNASPHANALTCASCHDAHIALRYPDAAGEGHSGITKECQDCHANKTISVNGTPKSIDCIACHMPPASKSAIGMQVGNGWRGDIKTHIFKINYDAETKEEMFTEDGGSVKLDEDGRASVTLDFVCLRCHTGQDVEWAAGFADDIHENGINTDVADNYSGNFSLKQNYPNPVKSNTEIEFSLSVPTQVNLSVFDETGRKVETLIEDYMPSGDHRITLDSQFLINGIYIYTLQTKEFSASKKMIVLR